MQYATGVRSDRTQLTTFRLTHEERAEIAHLAERLGVSKTDVVRAGIRSVSEKRAGTRATT